MGQLLDCFKSNRSADPMASLPHEVIVRGRSVETFSDLRSAGRYYIREYFEEWLSERVTCVVPPIPWTAYDRVLAPQPEGSKSKSKERGDDAELKVYKTFFECGKTNGEPMFLIAQIECNPENKTKQLPSVLGSFLPNNKQEQLALALKKLEIDLGIVHTDIGAILVEVKAATKPLAGIGDAVTSLQNAESLLRLFCDESFPIYKVAVFPYSESLSESQKCEMERLKRKNDFEYCDSTFSSQVVFDLLTRLKKVTSKKAYPELLEAANELLEHLICLKCLVTSTVRNSKVTRVITKDDMVNVAKQAKKTDTKLVQHDVFSKSDQKEGRVKKVEIATEVLFLNPQQIAIWDGPKHQILHGIAGTGKTVLIQHKVLELDKSLPPDEHIKVVATSAVSKVYEKFFDQNGASERISVDDELTYTETKAIELCQGHIFIDEGQNLENFREFLKAIGSNKSIEKYVWISLDPAQAFQKLPMSIENVTAVLGVSTPSTLYRVMRCTPDVTQFWSKHHLPSEAHVECAQGNRMFVQDVQIFNVSSDEEAEREVVEIIHNLLKKYVDGENITYQDCAVLLHSPPSLTSRIRSHLLLTFGLSDDDYLPGASNDMPAIEVIPDDIWSLEWSYVFLVVEKASIFPTREELARLNTPNHWNPNIYICSSRCKVQLFLIALETSKQNVEFPIPFIQLESIPSPYSEEPEYEVE